MKKVFEFMYLYRKIIPFILILVFLLSSCAASKDICAAYAYDDTQKDKDLLSDTELSKNITQ